MEALSTEISLQEAVQLGAVDQHFYDQFFFPKTVRQGTPKFHREMDDVLNDPEARYCSFMIFRGGAKTSKFRLYISRRIAYAISRTILIVGKSQGQAARTVEWIMRNVEYNTVWAETFALRKGKKWTAEECEIYHGADEVPIRLIALGITGSTRGINVDDYRPDLIGIDDPSDEENTANPEQREKTDDFINGSLRNSLAPKSECPDAKMVFLQTLLDSDDSISRCAKDPIWKHLTFSIFDENNESRWAERWSTAELLAEKQSFIARGKLHLWMREMECTATSNETAAFNRDQIQYWDILPPREESTFFLAIDPVPPPSDRELSKGLKGKDWECIAVVQRWKGKYYVADYKVNRGHDPDWTIMVFFQFLDNYPIMRGRVESVAYQRTLKWLLEKAMQQRRKWVQLSDGARNGKQDRRKKSYRIVDVMGSVLGPKNLYVNIRQVELIEQISAYPAVINDDVIETVSMAIDEAMAHGGIYDGDFERLNEADSDIPELDFIGACP